MCAMQNAKSAAEKTVSVRLPVTLVDEARALADASEGHTLGARTYAEILAAAARSGMPAVRAEVTPKTPRRVR